MLLILFKFNLTKSVFRNMTQNEIQDKWKALMTAKLANIKTLEEMQSVDENVKQIVLGLRELYKHKIDVVPPAVLMNIGGKLLGNYTSANTTMSIKRAERDAAEQSYEELLASLTVLNKNNEVGITEARSIAKEQLSECGSELIWREQHKNAYEAITDSAEKTISFIQSILRIRTSEQVKTKFADEA